MAYKPGESGNIKGRPVGSPNVATAEVRLFISNFIQANLKQIQSDYDSLEPYERLLFIERLFKYIMPKQIDANIHAFDLKQITGMVIQ